MVIVTHYWLNLCFNTHKPTCGLKEGLTLTQLRGSSSLFVVSIRLLCEQKRGTNRLTQTFLSRRHIFGIRKRPDVWILAWEKGKEKTDMRSRKRRFPITLLCVLAGLTVSACGFRSGTLPAGVPANAQPDALTITIPSFSPNRPTRTQMLVKVSQVQHLYQITTTLPPYEQPQSCPAVGGLLYTLTFLEKGKTIISATYASSGCGIVTFGQNDERTPTQEFSTLFFQAIQDTTPPIQADQLIVIHTIDPSQAPMHAKIGAAGAQILYDALRQLPTSSAPPECADTTGSRYTLTFHQANGDIPLQATIAAMGCTSAVEGHIRSVTSPFRHLLEQQIAEAGAAPAQPDSLSLAVFDAKTAKKGLMVYQRDLLDKLYHTLYALPFAREQVKSCTLEDTEKHFYLFFEQDGSDVLSVEAYQGGKIGCERVTFVHGSVRQPDQALWTLVAQAQAIATPT